MPEGDTVYRTARRLHEALAGEVLIRTDFRVPRFATSDLSGQRTDEVVSRGKHILHRVGGITIHSHLGMDGHWDVTPIGSRWKAPAYQARAVLEAETSSAVGFLLPVLELLPRDAEDDAVGHLGPDLLGSDWDADVARRNLVAAPERPIGLALLDQRIMAGIGNVYRNELCFLLGTLPTRPVGSVADPARVVELSHRVIVANRDRLARVTTGIDRHGRRLWVYGRARRPCFRCHTPIRTGHLGDGPTVERLTFWCPGCQR